MENETQDSLPENIADYVSAKIDILKLKAIDKTAAAGTGIIVGIMLFVFGWFTLMFLSFTAAIAISSATGKAYLGFLLVAVFYTLLAIVLVLLKEKLITVPIINALLKKFYYKPDAFKKPGS